MTKGFFIREEIGVTLHGNTKPLSHDVVPRSGRHLCPLDIKVVGLVRYCLPEVRVGLEPHRRISNFFNRIQAIMEYRHVWGVILALKNALELHLYGVANAITNRTF